MSVQSIVLIGEDVLRETAREVTDFESEKLHKLIEDLVDTMRSAELAGLSAPQIGESLRIFVSEIRETKYRKGETDELRVYINPEITKVSHETALGWEGCGSIPGLFGQVDRPVEITLNYQDENGVSHETSASGLLARVIQHEIDHLNGVLFTDLADPKTFVSGEYYVEHIRGE